MKKQTALFCACIASLLASCTGQNTSISSILSSKPSEESSAESSEEEASRTTPSYSYDESAEYDSGVGYEIFVGSFADSNKDGVGDLKGIEQHLDYLQSLGVTYLWLTPIHPSKTYHHYDVLDYFSISSDFGTMDDFKSLCQKANEKGMQIVMDMVFNHASVNSELFKAACADYASNYEGEGSKKDWFKFCDERPTDLPSQKVVYQEINYSGKFFYYECDFDSQMADFNLDCEEVKAFHKSVMDYWIDNGASGFRFDGCAYYYAGEKKKCVEYCTYLANSAKAIKEDVYLVGEAWEDSVTHIGLAAWSVSGMRFFDFANSVSYGSSSWNLYAGQGYGASGAKQIASIQTKLLSKTSTSEVALFLSNHDQDRSAPCFNLFAEDNDREQRLRATSSLYLLSPGTPFIYYGEEIKMNGLRGSSSTDANRRLPFLWRTNNDEARCNDPAGTTQTAASRPTIGALDMLEDSSSTVSHYKKVISLRKKVPAIRYGKYEAVDYGKESVCLMKIVYEGETYYLVHNFSKELESVTLPESFELIDDIQTVGYPSKVLEKTITLGAWSSAIVKAKGAN